MKLLKKNSAPSGQPTPPPAPALGATPKAPTPSSAKWTNGSALGARGVSALVGIAVVCGPVALGAQMFTSSAPVQSAPAQAEAALSTTQQSAGGYAVGYVGAWLSSTRDDSASLSNYFAGSTLSLSTTPFEYRNIAVASHAVHRRGSHDGRGRRRREGRATVRFQEGTILAAAVFPGRCEHFREHARRPHSSRAGRWAGFDDQCAANGLPSVGFDGGSAWRQRDVVPHLLSHGTRSRRALYVS